MSAAAPSIVERIGVERIGRASKEPSALGADVLVFGAIIDSWVEPAGSCDWDSRLVLQIAARSRPDELVIVEADAALVPDLGWLADLGENLCHGSPVSLRARQLRSGTLEAVHLTLDR